MYPLSPQLKSPSSYIYIYIYITVFFWNGHFFEDLCQKPPTTFYWCLDTHNSATRPRMTKSLISKCIYLIPIVDFCTHLRPVRSFGAPKIKMPYMKYTEYRHSLHILRISWKIKVFSTSQGDISELRVNFVTNQVSGIIRMIIAFI